MELNDMMRKYKNVYLFCIPGKGYSFAAFGGRDKKKIEYLNPLVNSFEEAQIIADKYLEKSFTMCRWKKPCESIFEMIFLYEALSQKDETTP